MTDTILKELKGIEQRENVRILFAVESGSRAWGFASPDSDYDVRFIYIRPKTDYLRLEHCRDVIELPISAELDINGWDLRKALQLAHRPNPTLYEWISSPIIYRGEPYAHAMREVVMPYFLAKSGLYHYLSMANRHFRIYLQPDAVKAKKYLYVLRPVLACRWILEKGTPPPVLFSALVEAELPAAMKPEVERLLLFKMNTAESGIMPRSEALNAYLSAELSELTAIVREMPYQPRKGWDELNAFFLSSLA